MAEADIFDVAEAGMRSYSIDPECPYCDEPFTGQAELIETCNLDGRVYQTVKCMECSLPWEIVIDYRKTATRGIHTRVRLATTELFPPNSAFLSLSESTDTDDTAE